MARVDSQGRLLIPRELLERLDYELKENEVYLCINLEKRTMYIMPTDKIREEDALVAKRKIDNKGRFFIGKETLEFFGECSIYTIWLDRLGFGHFCCKEKSLINR